MQVTLPDPLCLDADVLVISSYLEVGLSIAGPYRSLSFSGDATGTTVVD